ncbi:MAG: hypothetical protein AAGB04_08770 [Pseudomonadota bacterium]
MSNQFVSSELWGRILGILRGLSGSHYDLNKLLMSRWLWCAVVVLVVSGRALTSNAEQLFSGAGDSDDAMRLIQVREFLSHGNWFDPTLLQVGAPEALVSHWSRLLDLPIASLMLFFGLFLSNENAELAARIVWPVLLLFVLTLIVFREAERRGGMFAGGASLLFVFGGLAATMQFTPGRIDHHNVQILCAVGGTLLLLRSFREPQLGWVVGALFGIGLAVGLEALPFVVVILGIGSLCAAFDRAIRDGIVRTMIATAAVLLLAFLATTPPAYWYHVACDANGLNLIALASAGAVSMFVMMARFPQATPLQWIGGLAIGGGLGVAAYLALEPDCLAGPFGQVDPAVGPIWLNHVFEAKSLYHLAQTSPSAAISFFVFAALGVAACWINWREQKNIDALAALAVMVVALLYSCLYLKLMSYAMWIAIVPVAVMVARLPAYGELPERSVRIGAAVFCSQTMMLTVLSVIVGLFSDVENKAEAAWTASTADCQPRAVHQALASLPTGLVASEVDLGPFIALNTPHRVLAGPYHRIDKSILAAHHILASPPTQSEATVRRLGVNYVVICQRDQKTIDNMIDGSLMRRLQNGERISFLEPIVISKAKSPLRIWFVIPSGT